VTDAVIFDTSVVIDAEELDLAEFRSHAVLVSAITIGELAYGADLGPESDERNARLRRILHRYEVLPYGVEEAKL
jgi:predicted nucleic acid-binding protein